MVDAREYHERTNHTPRRLRESDFTMDRSIRPRPYKVYEDLPREPLPSIRPVRVPALSAVASSRADPLAGTDATPERMDRETLATLCYEASGVTEAVEVEDDRVRFRAASCTGKLYHVDLYLVCGDLPDLDAGVYHFDPDGFGLDVVREGDYRGVLAAATGGDEAATGEGAAATGGGAVAESAAATDDPTGVATAPVTVVATSTWWRNAWKYRERTYRHAFWDAGTVLANLLAASHAVDRRAAAVVGFADDPVVDLLGLDPDEEAPVAMAPIGRGDGAPAAPPVDPIDPATVPYSERQRDHPLIAEAWDQSTLADGEAAGEWRRSVPEDGLGAAAAGDGERVALDPVDHATASARPLHATVRRRRSCREFAAEPLSRRKLGTVLDRATRGVPGDWNGGEATGLALNDVYVLVTNVEAVPAGAYQFHPGEAALERVGDAAAEDCTRLALDQGWAGDAHVNVYCMADVGATVERLGNRGYRLAQLEAGIVLGRLYLATYAHRDLGGTGLTFFDGMVSDFLSSRAGDRAPMTLFAMGVAGD